MSKLLLSIFLIPKGEEQSDDKIYVRQLPNTMLEIEHYDGKINKKYKMCIYPSEFNTYITNVTTLYVYDTQPFENMQFNFLGFPSFMTSRKELTENRTILPTLLSAASTVIRSMENEVPPRAESPRGENHY